MKKVTVTISGWRERTKTEIAETEKKLALVQQDRSNLWAEEKRLHDKMREATADYRQLRRDTYSKIRTPIDFQVAFNGVHAPEIVGDFKLSERDTARIIARAVKQYKKEAKP